MSTDWDLFQKCPVCFAALGKPCKDRTWAKADGIPVVESEDDSAEPHTGRKLRAAAARAVGRG